ncbi:MAG: Exodeoxyribonuclease, partial [Fibrobacteres bacterium]|nr:Exodeoxyribonuclease [Fibrobacterota bacterium]
LSGGVNVAGLGALRSLPFKLIHVLGLGEGEFPDEDSASTLDLRQYRRVIGDIDPAGRNRYLFLETLICASGKLRLSYISRDVQQGKTFQMCSVLNELKDYVEECVLAPADPESVVASTVVGDSAGFIVTQVPLLSRSPDLFRKGQGKPWDPPPNPFREERLLAWMADSKAADPGFPGKLQAHRDRHPVREVYPARMDPPREAAVPALQAIPLDDIRIFLSNPAQYALRKRLGIRDHREEDPMEADVEPFFCPDPMDRDLLEKVIQFRIASGDGATRQDCHRHFLALYANLALRGLMPEGHFRDLDQDLLWKRAEAMLDGLDKYFEGIAKDGRTQDCIPGVLLGHGSARSTIVPTEDPVSRLPPLRLRVAGRDVELHGELPCLFRDHADGRCSTVVFCQGSFSPRRLLPAFLFYVAGAASEGGTADRLRAAPFTIHYVHRKFKNFETGNWAPFRITREEARAYLESLLTDMLTGTDFDLLPFDAIAAKLARKGFLESGPDYAQVLRDELEFADENPDFFGAETPESQVLLDPQVPADAEAKIRARLGPFFNFKPDAGDGR